MFPRSWFSVTQILMSNRREKKLLKSYREISTINVTKIFDRFNFAEQNALVFQLTNLLFQISFV